MVIEPTMGCAPLDLLYTNREVLVGNMVVGSCLGYSSQKVIEFLILCDTGWEVSKTYIGSGW